MNGGRRLRTSTLAALSATTEAPPAAEPAVTAFTKLILHGTVKTLSVHIVRRVVDELA
jgi:hypothetical protein